jgi:hypothetical protein
MLTSGLSKEWEEQGMEHCSVVNWKEEPGVKKGGRCQMTCL